MNKSLLAACLLCIPVLAVAGNPIAVSEVPAAVTRAIDSYFPDAQIRAAELDTYRDRIKYELQIQYRDIRLEVDVAADGRILDVDMD